MTPERYKKKLASTQAWRERMRAEGKMPGIYRKYNYGLTPESYDLLCKKHPHCAICKRADKPLVVDHDHQTEKVRGRLCVNCNTALGKFGDSPALLNCAIEYLNQHRSS